MTAASIPPLSVLIVEDVDDAAESTAELLALWGHRVRITTCAGEALRAVAEEVPDVILLDIGLPGMDGWELAGRMREQADGKQPYVVAVTGYATDGDRVRSANSGIDLHLAKPTDPATLTSLLIWVRAKRAEDAADGGTQKPMSSSTERLPSDPCRS